MAHVASAVINLSLAFAAGYFLASWSSSSPLHDCVKQIDDENAQDSPDFIGWKQPFVHTDETKIVYAAHGEKIEKKVLVKRGELPHVNQVAMIKLKPGQVATENYHNDMSEIFFITSGDGEFKYDGKTSKISKGSTIRAMPGHKHEVTNDGEQDLDMLVVAVAHDCPSISKQRTQKFNTQSSANR